MMASMSSSRVETAKSRPVPMLLVIGGNPELVAACTAAAAPSAAVVRDCDVASAATMAAQWMPLAILVPEDVYAFDPDEFEALARDVRAGLVRIEDRGMSIEDLQSALVPAMALGEQLRGV